MANHKHSKEFKLETLALAKEVGVTQAGRRLEINSNLIYRWRQELESDGEKAFRGQGVMMTAQDAEIARLRRENADLKEDKEILKKAIEIFFQKKVSSRCNG